MNASERRETGRLAVAGRQGETGRMRTVGVEEEMLLVDIHSGRPRAVSDRLLSHVDRSWPSAAGAGSEVGGSIDTEFQQEQVETDTRPVERMDALEAELRVWRDRAIAAARETGSRVAAMGTSPLPVEPSRVAEPRYLAMEERFGLTAKEQLTCGCHVHVSVESDDEGVAVLDRIRVWLPSLLALSANSPFWEGQDSSYASYRSQAMTRWPASGPTEPFGSAAGYHRLVDDMTESGVLLDKGMVYFDARLSHRYPTVEIRAADVCLDIGDAVVLAALCRALVETSAAGWLAGEPAPEASTALLRLATWQAGRDGVTGLLLDPRTHRPAPAPQVIGQLFAHVQPALASAGDQMLVESGLDRLLARGSGAVRQRAVMERTGSLVDVVADAVRVTAGHESA